MGFGFNPLIWFACGYCKQHCANLKNLKRHKLQSHLGECLKVKCIIFEEKCLEEEWKPGDRHYAQCDRGEQSIPSLKRKQIAQHSHSSVDISSQGRGFMNPYVSLPQLASQELSRGTVNLKFAPDLKPPVSEVDPGHSSGRQRCRPSDRKRSAQNSLIGPREGKLLISNSKQYKFASADTTQQNQNDLTECKNEAVISFNSNTVKYEDNVNSPALNNEIDADVTENKDTADLDIDSINTHTKKPVGKAQPKTNSAEGEQMNINEFIDCQLGPSTSASASPSSSISDETEKPQPSSETEVLLLKTSSLAAAAQITTKYTTRRNKPKINYSENHRCNYCSEEYNTFAELSNHQIFCKPSAISPQKSRIKIPRKVNKVSRDDEVLISDSDNDDDSDNHNEIQNIPSTDLKSKIISKTNDGKNKSWSFDSDENFELSNEAAAESSSGEDDNEVSHLDDFTDEDDDSDEDYIIALRPSHRRPRLQKQPRKKSLTKRTKDNSNNYSKKDPKTRYKCKVCGKEFKIRRNCEYHEQCHENPEKANPFKCNLCDLAFRFQNILDNHIKTHSSDRDYKCEECGLSWRNKTSLERHQAVHGVVLTFKCNFCEKSFINRGKLESHERTHTGDRPFKCSVENCDCAFHSQSALAAHLRLKHGEELGMEKYLCPQCGKTFWVPSHLTYHIRRFHTDKKDKPFKCSEEGCTKTFSMKIQLKRHLALHNGEKPFICDQCGMAFAYGTSLKKHQLRHVNEHDEDNQVKVVPTCHLCSKTFAKNSKLKRHMKSHKEGENLKYQCEFCEVKVITKSLLTKHLKIDHGFEFGKGQNPIGMNVGDGRDINSGSDSDDAASGNEGENCIVGSAPNILANA